jgi:hypothetical protein
MRLILEITSGPREGEKIELEPGQIVRVGRALGKADFATQDKFMSGAHFAVECGSQSCGIKDLGSRNGTLLNGEKLSAAVLHDGDKIFAGQSDFVVRVEVGEASRPTSTPQQSANANAFAPPQSARPEEMAARRGDSLPTFEVPQPKAKSSASAKADPGTVPFKGSAFESAPPTTDQLRVQKVLDAASASTPKGRLLQILREQPEPLFALVDALQEPKLLELLRGSSDEHQPLYEGGAHAPEKIPYLVRLSAESKLLESLVNHGWGKNWGVYLTCDAPLDELRNYFRQSLMVKAGALEFFFRFYEPRFLRDTLRASPHAEASKFFGPASSYLVEAEKPEILLQFTKTSREVELRERLLLLPGT